MNKKILNLLLVIVLTVTSIIALPTETQAAKWDKAYNKKIKTFSKSETGIYSQYYLMKMDKSKTPVLVIKRIESTELYSGDSYRLIFYKYKKGKAKKIGSYKIAEGTDGDFNTVYKQGKKLVFTAAIGDIGKVFKFSMKNGKIVRTTYSEIWTWDTVNYYKGKKKITKKLYKKAVGKLKKTIEFNDNW